MQPIIDRNDQSENISELLLNKHPIIGRHVSWLRNDVENRVVRSAIIAFESIALTLTVWGLYPLSQGYRIWKKLDSYDAFIEKVQDVKKPGQYRFSLKTAVSTYNHTNDYLLHEELLWTKPKDSDEEWKPVYCPVIPMSIDADGANLIVVDKERNIHYKKVLKEVWKDGIYFFVDKSQKDNWKSNWFSLPYIHRVYNLIFGGKLKLPENTVAWAISHRGKYNHHYTDGAGKSHVDNTGITSLFTLNDKDEIRYADPWLPFGFSYKIEGPKQPHFKPLNIAASASTLFLVGKCKKSNKWHMFTRLVDFDTLGLNPLIRYTHDKNCTDPHAHFLPPEEWREQPAIPLKGSASLSKNITIYQTGQGNGARELIVEGSDSQGYYGLYQKSITASEPSDWKISEP